MNTLIVVNLKASVCRLNACRNLRDSRGSGGRRKQPERKVLETKPIPYQKQTCPEAQSSGGPFARLEDFEVSSSLWEKPLRKQSKHSNLWRIQDEERRVRRMVPLPVSLTGLGLGDGSSARFWRHRLKKASIRLERETEIESDSLVDKVIPSLRVFLNHFSGQLSDEHKKVYENYVKAVQELKDRKGLNASKPAPVLPPIQFPFSEEMNLRKYVREPEDVERAPRLESGLLDVEYDNYLKHHKLLQFLAHKFNKVKPDEYDVEIEAWSDQLWRRNYGQPDPSIAPSDVPCGGCGAHLHCTDTSIPGYIPSEKFVPLSRVQLHEEHCQRCQFLHHYNVALNVTVKADDYPQIISQIQRSNSLVVLLVDLMDFPCSIWPNVINLIGRNRKVYVVGNKVDLLPKDSKGYLERVEDSLRKTLHVAGVAPDVNIRHLCLISAKTGYGVEPLVTKLMNDWNGRGDMYLVGCTNVGKSTLFNALMQSDLCSLREKDLIQRATTSVWPGTTLNLLKFPVKRAEGWEMKLRMERLRREERYRLDEKKLQRSMYRQTRDNQHAMLSDRIGMTFRDDVPFTLESGHPFAKKSHSPKPFNPKDKVFANCHFFHDTPGTFYREQALTLLTTEELLKTVPREVITPRTFSLQPLQTLFIGGLARLDVAHSRQNVWLTVFASHYLPIHVVYTEEARRFYEGYLGTEMLGVPLGGPERIEKWPSLVPKEIDLNGISWRQSCADIVLSSAGWVAVTLGRDESCVLRAFTPEGRGIFVRDPPVLPYAFELRGRRVRGTPCFESPVSSIEEVGDDDYNDRLYNFR